MTLDWADGIALGNVVALDNAGHDLNDLAKRIIETFLRVLAIFAIIFFDLPLKLSSSKIKTFGFEAYTFVSTSNSSKFCDFDVKLKEELLLMVLMMFKTF